MGIHRRKKEERESDFETLKREIEEETDIKEVSTNKKFVFYYHINTFDQKRQIKYYLVKYKDEEIKISKKKKLVNNNRRKF